MTLLELLSMSGIINMFMNLFKKVSIIIFLLIIVSLSPVTVKTVHAGFWSDLANSLNEVFGGGGGGGGGGGTSGQSQSNESGDGSGWDPWDPGNDSAWSRGDDGGSRGGGTAGQSQSNESGDGSGWEIWDPGNDSGGGAARISQAQYNAARGIVTDPVAIAKIAAQVGGMTTPQFLAYVRTLDTVDQIAAQAARNLGNNRDVTINGNSIDVAWCNNGVGGTWEVVAPPVVNRPDVTSWPSDSDNDDPPQNPAFCAYLLANGQAGNVTITEPGPVTLSWQVNYAQSGTITPEPGAFTKRVGSASVNVTEDTVFELNTSNAYGSDSCAVNVTIGEGEEICTDSSAENYKATGACTYKDTSGNPTVSAVIEALVFIEGGGVYSGDDRYVASSNLTDENPDNDYPIYLRWQGVQSNGKLANYCIGTTPEDYTAPGNAAKGSFEEGDGRGTPYPGLENGESKTYTVQCFNDYGSDTDSVTLTGITDFTGQPPTITADGKPKLAIVPYGKEVEIAWNPNGNRSCSLSKNLKTDISNPAAAANNTNQFSNNSANLGTPSQQQTIGSSILQGVMPNNTANTTPVITLPGSEMVTVTGESTYTITCEGGSDSVKVMVLPMMEET